MHIILFHSEGVAAGWGLGAGGRCYVFGAGDAGEQCCVEELPFCLDSTSEYRVKKQSREVNVCE